MVAHNLTVEAWPDAWGRLKAVKLFGSGWIDVNATAPAEVLVSGPQLRGGAAGSVILQFENELPDDVRSAAGFLETVSGCRIPFGAAEPAADTP